MKNGLSRRDFLSASSIALAAAFLAACKWLTPPASAPAPTAPPTDTRPTRLPDQPPKAATQVHSAASPVSLDPPLDDTPEVFLNTYYGAVGSSPPTPQNPQGIHMGMDFVALTGTAIQAAAPGKITRITIETKTEPDGTVNTYGGVLQDIGGNNTLGYGFEPLQKLFVSEGQVVKAGDMLGLLADNRGQNMRGTKGTGTLDLMLLSLVDGSFKSVCFVPYASPTFKALMETWFSRAYKPSAEHPGPCTCHYAY